MLIAVAQSGFANPTSNMWPMVCLCRHCWVLGRLGGRWARCAPLLCRVEQGLLLLLLHHLLLLPLLLLPLLLLLCRYSPATTQRLSPPPPAFHGPTNIWFVFFSPRPQLPSETLWDADLANVKICATCISSFRNSACFKNYTYIFLINWQFVFSTITLRLTMMLD